MKAWIGCDYVQDLGWVLVWTETRGQAKAAVKFEVDACSLVDVRVLRAPALDGEPLPTAKITEEIYLRAGMEVACRRCEEPLDPNDYRKGDGGWLYCPDCYLSIAGANRREEERPPLFRMPEDQSPLPITTAYIR